MPREQWRIIPERPLYQISSLGRVRNIQTGYILKQFENREGYLRLQLGGSKNYAVHILVAKAFIPNPENKPEVNHKRGKKQDNRASQLEWTTKQDNIIHSFSLRRKRPHQAPILVVTPTGDRDVVPTMTSAVKRGYATSLYGVHACCYNKARTHNGHSFAFLF